MIQENLVKVKEEKEKKQIQQKLKKQLSIEKRRRINEKLDEIMKRLEPSAMVP